MAEGGERPPKFFFVRGHSLLDEDPNIPGNLSLPLLTDSTDTQYNLYNLADPGQCAGETEAYYKHLGDYIGRSNVRTEEHGKLSHDGLVDKLLHFGSNH